VRLRLDSRTKKMPYLSLPLPFKFTSPSGINIRYIYLATAIAKIFFTLIELSD
jgi:hypothetical protein